MNIDVQFFKLFLLCNSSICVTIIEELHNFYYRFLKKLGKHSNAHKNNLHALFVLPNFFSKMYREN